MENSTVFLPLLSFTQATSSYSTDFWGKNKHGTMNPIPVLHGGDKPVLFNACAVKCARQQKELMVIGYKVVASGRRKREDRAIRLLKQGPW